MSSAGGLSVRFSTRAIHGHGHEDHYGSIVPPIYLPAINKYIDSEECAKSDRGIPYKYLREENPTVRAFEWVVASLGGIMML